MSYNAGEGNLKKLLEVLRVSILAWVALNNV